MSRIVVFLGPSLERRAAEQLLDGEYRPPAAQGDVYAAVEGGAKAILLIDGVFQSVASVWHKEILWALWHGTHVFGAASMGALRAAELDAFGMLGIGSIYQDYRDGVLERDDEVSVIHAPAELSYVPLSLALVDIRATLEAAVVAGVIGQGPARRVLSHAAETYFADRTWKTVLADGPATSSRLRDWINENSRSQKREDAIEAITHVRDVSADILSCPFEPAFEFIETILWQHMLAWKRNPFLRLINIS